MAFPSMITLQTTFRRSLKENTSSLSLSREQVFEYGKVASLFFDLGTVNVNCANVYTFVAQDQRSQTAPIVDLL